MKKHIKEYTIILYDFFVENFGERVALIIIFPSAIIILGIIGYCIMLLFKVFGLGDIEWVIGIGLILFIIIFSPKNKERKY